MHTQNVNVAASESSKTWVKASALWVARKNYLLTALAKIEGDLLMYLALGRLAVEVEDYEYEYLCSREAGVIVSQLEELGAIASEDVYDMVCSVEALSLVLNAACWKEIYPGKLPELACFIDVAGAFKTDYIAEAAEGLKPFSVDVEGRKEYPEDDPIYGTYWQDGLTHLGRAWTLEEAMDIAAAAWVKDDWDPREAGEDYYDSDFGRDMGPVSFSPRMFIIHDSERRRVLTGDAIKMIWHSHVTDPDDIARIKTEQQVLRQEAATESGWDNFETARQLRVQADKLGAPVVDAFWLGHPDVMAALAAFIRPERKTWGAKLNTVGLSKFMADDMTSLIAISDRTSQLSRGDRSEALYSVALSIAGHVSRSVTDWSLPCPKIPAAVIRAWLLTREIVVAAFGESGETVWKGIKGSLIAHLNENRPPF